MKLFKSIFVDLMLILGFLSLVYGVYLMYKPASFVVGGLVLLAAFVPNQGRESPEKRKKEVD